jgi:hypothetical protein
MTDSFEIDLEDSTLNASTLAEVVADKLDRIPTDFDDQSRFLLAATRAAATRAFGSGFCVFVYSECATNEAMGKDFQRVAHMQDGYGEIIDSMTLTNRDANNGMCRILNASDPAGIFSELEAAGFGAHCTVVWDATHRTASFYPDGVGDDSRMERFIVPADKELSQDEVCAVLDEAYEDNLKNPSGGTIRLWKKGDLVERAEEVIESHLRGQLSMYFRGQKRPVMVQAQIPTPAGRTDLMFLQRPLQGGAPTAQGVLELKVLRGPEKNDKNDTAEGLSQGYQYRSAFHLPFATLALFDVTKSPSNDPDPLLLGQKQLHLDHVRVRRFALFDSPKAWRDAA